MKFRVNINFEYEIEEIKNLEGYEERVKLSLLEFLNEELKSEESITIVSTDVDVKREK